MECAYVTKQPNHITNVWNKLTEMKNEGNVSNVKE